MKFDRDSIQFLMWCNLAVAIISLVMVLVSGANYFVFDRSDTESLLDVIRSIETVGITVSVYLFVRNVYRKEKPFSTQNMKYLSFLGAWVTVYELLAPVIAPPIGYAFGGQVVQEGLELAFDGNTGIVYLGIAIIIISKIFQYGIQLQKEMDSIA